MLIFSWFLKFFSKIGNKIVIQLDFSSFTAIINVTQTAVIDQFIALKNRKLHITYHFGIILLNTSMC